MAQPQRPPVENVDVVVIGAGPAGTTVATTLARAGRSVLVLEKQRFPRFHIGESGLPPTLLILKELGAYEHIMAQGFVTKYGAEFNGGTRGRFGRIPFDGQGPGRQPTAIQVERSRYDTALRDFAVQSGATILHEANVTTLLRDGDRVTGLQYTYEGREHTVNAAYVVDAGGRASKIAQTFNLRRSVERQKMVAVFRHYGNLDESKNPGHEGDIQIGEHGDGWVWAIPIGEGKISVGTVMPRAVLQGAPDRDTIFEEHLSRVGRIVARLEGTEPHGETKIETDYYYYSDTVAGPGWFMVGDAGCFFDPIFSAGVFLASVTAWKAGLAIDEILSSPERVAPVQEAYSNFYKTGYDIYARLIYAYYEAGYSLRGFLKSAGFDISGDELGENPWVCRIVSGDFWNDRNVLVRHLLSRPSWDTFAPFERHWGCPFYADLNLAEESATVG